MYVESLFRPTSQLSHSSTGCLAAYITDLLDGKIGIGGNTSISPSSFRSDIHNNHDRSRTESLEQFRDFQIR
jgi:hypothetical protein